MKTWLKVLLITLAVLFLIGAVTANYNCSSPLCGAVNSVAHFTTEVFKTVIAGLNTVIGGIRNIVT